MTLFTYHPFWLYIVVLTAHCTNNTDLITTTVINWAESFVSGLTFQVSVNGALYLMAEGICGVLQFSVIGPILLVIDVNDLYGHLSADSPLYFDDVEDVALVTTMTFSESLLMPVSLNIRS